VLATSSLSLLRKLTLRQTIGSLSSQLPERALIAGDNGANTLLCQRIQEAASPELVLFMLQIGHISMWPQLTPLQDLPWWAGKF